MWKVIMKTLRETAKNIGYLGSLLSTLQLAESMKINSPLSVRQLIERGSYSMDSAIRDKWAESGWETGTLGNPTTETLSLSGEKESIRYNDFERGSLYWTAKYGAHIVLDPIRTKLKNLIAAGHKPAPIDDTVKATDGEGLVNNFDSMYTKYPDSEKEPPLNIAHWAAIYWSSIGAFFLSTYILDKWRNELAGENGALGYPITDMIEHSRTFKTPAEHSEFTDISHYQRFQHGTISMFTGWSAWPSLPVKLYVKYGDDPYKIDPFPQEYYDGPKGSTGSGTTPSQPGKWSLRLEIAPIQLYPNILWISSAKWTITPTWDNSLGRTLDGTTVTFTDIPSPPLDQPYNQSVNVALSFKYIAKGEIDGIKFDDEAQGAVAYPDPAPVKWTGKDLKAGWLAFYNIIYPDKVMVVAQLLGSQPN